MFTRNKKILTGVSVVALMACGPAFAENARTANQNDVPHYDEQEVKQGLKDTKENVSDAAENVSKATKKTYEDIKEAINSKETADISPVKINQHTAAEDIIGKPVYNASGDRVAKVKDIILNKDGDAIMVVLADGEWTGLGKLAAFDYKVITQTNADGDVIAPLTEEMISNAVPFSYDHDNSDGSVKVVPQNGYSVAELLESELIDPEGKTVAVIDNITFRNGEADRLVVGFGQTFGLGGKKAAMGFKDPDIVNKDGRMHFKLSASQAKQFEVYKETALN